MIYLYFINLSKKIIAIQWKMYKDKRFIIAILKNDGLDSNKGVPKIFCGTYYSLMWNIGMIIQTRQTFFKK